MNIQEVFNYLKTKPSDINEHLEMLYTLTKECKTVTEFGVRSVISSWAFLAALPEKITSFDIKHPYKFNAHKSFDAFTSLAKENNVIYNFNIGDTTKIKIEQTDLLFIDTWHVYDLLKIELERHSTFCNKYIVMHDTTTFGQVGESLDGKEYKGLWPAIEEFLNLNTEWHIKNKYENNNGLTVLQRI